MSLRLVNKRSDPLLGSTESRNGSQLAVVDRSKFLGRRFLFQEREESICSLLCAFAAGQFCFGRKLIEQVVRCFVSKLAACKRLLLEA